MASIHALSLLYRCKCEDHMTPLKNARRGRCDCPRLNGRCRLRIAGGRGGGGYHGGGGYRRWSSRRSSSRWSPSCFRWLLGWRLLGVQVIGVPVTGQVIGVPVTGARLLGWRLLGTRLGRLLRRASVCVYARRRQEPRVWVENDPASATPPPAAAPNPNPNAQQWWYWCASARKLLPIRRHLRRGLAARAATTHTKRTMNFAYKVITAGAARCARRLRDGANRSDLQRDARQPQELRSVSD